MDEISTLTLATAAVIVLVSGLVHGTLGMGFPVISTPLLAVMVDVRLAILLTLLPTVTVNVGSILNGRDWRATVARFWPLAVYGVAGSALGSQLLVSVDPAPFRLLLAGLVLAYLAVSRPERGTGRLRWIRERPALAMLVFGLGAGLAGGTTNVMVTLLLVYALETDLQRPAMVSMLNLCFLSGKLAQIGVFALAGLLTGPLVLATAGLAALAAGGLYAGMRIQDRIDAALYRRLVRAVLLGLAALLVVQFLRDVS